MAFLLQSLKNFADSHALLKVGVALGAGALLVLGYCYYRPEETTQPSREIF